MASPDLSASTPHRRSGAGRRGAILLWMVNGWLASGCSSVSPSHLSPTACYLVLENQTGYTWQIHAAPLAEDVETVGLNWRVAPATAITVELAAPQPWRLTQSLPVHGTSRTTDFAGEAGVTYRWPLATLHSVEPAR